MGSSNDAKMQLIKFNTHLKQITNNLLRNLEIKRTSPTGKRIYIQKLCSKNNY